MSDLSFEGANIDRLKQVSNWEQNVHLCMWRSWRYRQLQHSGTCQLSLSRLQDRLCRSSWRRACLAANFARCISHLPLRAAGSSEWWRWGPPASSQTDYFAALNHSGALTHSLWVGFESHFRSIKLSWFAGGTGRRGLTATRPAPWSQCAGFPSAASAGHWTHRRTPAGNLWPRCGGAWEVALILVKSSHAR